jgi:hypothetical protein
MKKTGAQIFAIFIVTILILIFYPFLTYWTSYFCGWLAKITIGPELCGALNLLFKTSYFKPSMLPKVAGALGWIGGFFHGVSRTSSSKK